MKDRTAVTMIYGALEKKTRHVKAEMDDMLDKTISPAEALEAIQSDLEVLQQDIQKILNRRTS